MRIKRWSGQMSRAAEDDRLVPFGEGGPVETLDKLAWIRQGCRAPAHQHGAFDDTSRPCRQLGHRAK